jgi:protein SCO1/2
MWVVAAPAPQGRSSAEPAPELQGVGIDEALGYQLDLTIMVTKEDGAQVPLSHFFSQGKPVMLSFVYYNCPGLCSLHLNGVLDAMKEIDWSAGKEYQYLTVSFDGKEGPDLAMAKKQNYLKNYKREGADQGWHFLTASQSELDKLTKALGFKYRWDEASQEWAHSSAVIFMSPSGKVTRYLHGVVFEPDQLKLALNEAVSGTIGTVVDKLVWYCFKYDPKQSKYVLYAFRLVQLGGGLIVLILAVTLLPIWMRERKLKESV